ncbi:MAG: hypothetical protein DRP61_02185 [Candidatus Omnitrophota bacterium]|nr:MAG: hypothetical protein DRP61_02185 [Candidatus Omnitrophota bacterium]RKY33583.1 MAG: hypothetical protein DRP69_06160 [Candidatus Omnitrophota bacterium]RKY43546.1 MAG: hypothetical protein DRP80_04915 [Candidatus Omnitrophota bacterium]
MVFRKDLLGKILIKKGVITPAQLEEALEIQKNTKEFLGSILLRKNFIKEEDLLEAFSEQLDIPFLKFKDIKIDWGLADKFSNSLILEKKCFPLKVESDFITLAITNPLDAWTISQAQSEAQGYQIKIVLVSSKDMERLLEMYNNYLKKKIKDLLK